MQTVILEISDSKYEFLLKLISPYKEFIRIKSNGSSVAETEPIATLWDAAEYPIIQEKLREKYVISGKWQLMNDDERQDAALLEHMLLNQNDDDELLSDEETNSFLAQLSVEKT